METEIKMTLAEKLTTLRKKNGLTQLELAEKLNVSRQAVSRWEVGAAVPSTDNLKFLSELYSIPVDYLLNENSDYSSEIIEIQEGPDNEKSVRKISKVILACILAAVMAVGSYMLASFVQKDKDIFPMKDMDIVEEDNGYSTETFLID